MDENIECKLPIDLSAIAFTFWNNSKEKMDDNERFFYVFSMFYNLGKYNDDPIDPSFKLLIDTVKEKLNK